MEGTRVGAARCLTLCGLLGHCRTAAHRAGVVPRKWTKPPWESASWLPPRLQQSDGAGGGVMKSGGWRVCLQNSPVLCGSTCAGVGNYRFLTQRDPHHIFSLLPHKKNLECWNISCQFATLSVLHKHADDDEVSVIFTLFWHGHFTDRSSVWQDKPPASELHQIFESIFISICVWISLTRPAASFLWSSCSIGFIYGVVAAMTREERYMRDDSGGIQSLANREKLQKKRSELPHHLWKHTIFLWFVNWSLCCSPSKGQSSKSSKERTEGGQWGHDFFFKLDFTFGFDRTRGSIHHFETSPCHTNSVHEYVAVNSGEATNPNTQKQPKGLAFVSVDEAKKQALPFLPKVVRRHQRWSIAWLVPRLHQWIKMKLLRKHLMAAPIRLKWDCWHFKWSWAFCSLLRARSETITLPSTPSPSKTGSNQRRRPTSRYLPLSFSPRLPSSLFSPSASHSPFSLPFSQSPSHSFSPGANVYISCNRLLRGAPEFILQPVVMARFLDKSWQPLVVDS